MHWPVDKHVILSIVTFNYEQCLPSDLLESMRQAELCDWALDSGLFTSLCDSLNRFFTQKGMIGSSSGNNSPLALGVHPSIQGPHFSMNPPPTLASLTQPSPLQYPPLALPFNGAQLPRRTLHHQGQGLQRPQFTQPASTGKSYMQIHKLPPIPTFRYDWYGYRWACWLWTLKI